MSKKQEVANVNKSAWWAWAIKNSISIICFTVLAIAFGKWWIVLFVGLFLSGLQFYGKHYRVCDFCGKHSPYTDSRNEAIKIAEQLGWSHYKKENLDYCPECRKEFDNKIAKNAKEYLGIDLKL